MAAFAHYLPHFAIGSTGAEPGDTPREDVSAVVVEGLPFDEVAAAEERGREAALAEARAAGEAALQELEADHALRLEEQKQLWAEETAEALAAQVKEGLTTLEDRISGHVADVLMQFMDSALREKSMAELSTIVRSVCTSGEASEVKVTGPEALVEKLRGLLGEDVPAISFDIAEDRRDVSVEVDDTLVKTHLAAWSGSLEAAMTGNVDE